MVEVKVMGLVVARVEEGLGVGKDYVEDMDSGVAKALREEKGLGVAKALEVVVVLVEDRDFGVAKAFEGGCGVNSM